jgi:uncharacterized protein (TIGR00299 family) protein
MRIAYIDCVAGASGDMLLGALLDLGLPLDQLQEKLSLLNLSGFNLQVEEVQKNHLRATHLKVKVTDHTTERKIPEINRIIQQSDLHEDVKGKALDIIQRLGATEARIHGTRIDEVHLHELGGIDTIIDIVGFILGLELLEIDEIIASPIPLGRGFIQSAHGKLPIPAPATLELLQGIPVYSLEIESELVTPTGAVLLTSLASRFGGIPPLQLEKVGYGAGTRDLPIPNVIRIYLGTKDDEYPSQAERLILFETNIDDLNPEVYEHVMDRLFAEGALDVSLFPIHMKKNRPGIMLQVLSPPEIAYQLKNVVYLETSTLGIRQQVIERECLTRRFETVQTIYGPVQMKVADLGGGQIKYSPEYEDCKSLAQELEIPIQVIMKAAEVAFEGKEK